MLNESLESMLDLKKKLIVVECVAIIIIYYLAFDTVSFHTVSCLGSFGI